MRVRVRERERERSGERSEGVIRRGLLLPCAEAPFLLCATATIAAVEVLLLLVLLGHCYRHALRGWCSCEEGRQYYWVPFLEIRRYTSYLGSIYFYNCMVVVVVLWNSM